MWNVNSFVVRPFLLFIIYHNEAKNTNIDHSADIKMFYTPVNL